MPVSRDGGDGAATIGRRWKKITIAIERARRMPEPSGYRVDPISYRRLRGVPTKRRSKNNMIELLSEIRKMATFLMVTHLMDGFAAPMPVTAYPLSIPP